MRQTKSKPDRLTRIRIAGIVPCDPRTVDRYFDPQLPLTTIAEHNIRKALHAFGIDDPRASKAAGTK